MLAHVLQECHTSDANPSSAGTRSAEVQSLISLLLGDGALLTRSGAHIISGDNLTSSIFRCMW
jgi:hypothetical protein